MQFVAAVFLALAICSDAAVARLTNSATHPAGHLFARSALERRTPVELYQGIDPQLVERDDVAPVPFNPRIKRSCTHDVYELAPRHLKDEHGHLLEKRQSSTNSPNTGTPYPPAGSDPPPASSLPKAWVDKYQQVKSAGLIPDIPVATLDATSGLPSYPAGYDKTKVCSWTLDKCNVGNIYQAPDDAVAFGIDDGPTTEGTPPFLTTLENNNISATHFLIGSAIVWNMKAMKNLATAKPAQHLGVHTWSHSLQTIKTDMEVLGDLGWTMQIIYDVSGEIPMYFRPPEGDVDARVKAIAKYVFGMQTVMWTHDANDWCLRQGTGTAKTINECVQTAPNLAAVEQVQDSWAAATNTSGWITLNHETTDQAAAAFKSLIKSIKKGNWDIVGNVADLQGLPWYNNAYGPNDTPATQANILPTRDFINVTNPTAAKGSKQAPNLGNWAKVAATENPNLGSQAVSSSTSGSSTSQQATTSSGNATTSGALGSVSAGIALTLISFVGTAMALLM